MSLRPSVPPGDDLTAAKAGPRRRQAANPTPAEDGPSKNLDLGHCFGAKPPPMGRGDNRHTPKMLRRKNQRRLKDRMRRRAEQVRRERSGETATQEQA
jgi:hypothetical protein